MDKKVKVRVVLLTEACPLACRYCDLKNDAVYGHFPAMSKEELFSLIDVFDKEDDQNTTITRINFTGGEPFLYWQWIKEIIEKYGHRFQYSFNTSGYLFTEEILEFLSHYQVSFVLSVDGNEKLTNYLRPVHSNPYKTGYYKQLVKILPSLLYYFPTTPYRIIIHPRYVDLMYQMYCEADRLGCKYFTFVLDFESRPERIIPKDKKMMYWEDKHTEILQQQMDLIVQDIIIGMQQNIAKPRLVEVDRVIAFLLNQQPYDTNNLPCQLFSKRTLTTVASPNDTESNCLSSFFPNLQAAQEALEQAYQNQNHQCIYDSECEAFEYCALNCCPQRGMGAHGDFFHFDPLECALNKVAYNSALKLLTICADVCPNNKLYTRYINTFDYPGKKEVLM